MKIQKILHIGILLVTSALLALDPLQTPLTSHTVIKQEILKPSTVQELQKIVIHAHQEHRKITIAGARASQGGQTTYKDAYLIDMTNFNKVLHIDTAAKKVTVQAGITWAALQEVLNPIGLAVSAMQSYATFSVGGAIGVNAHGQDIRHAPLIKSIDSFKIMLADGTIVNASRKENNDLFSAAIGGYGLFGIIIEATLLVTDNALLRRTSHIIKTDTYHNVINTVKNNEKAHLHSIRLSLNPLALFRSALAITYYQEEPHCLEPLKPLHDKVIEYGMHLLDISNHYTFIKPLRLLFEKVVVERPNLMSRNNAMRYSAERIMRTNQGTCDILQEYFIPYKHVPLFIDSLKKVVQDHHINLLNVTIRWVPADRETLMSYAPTDCGALVLYCSIDNSWQGYQNLTQWTRQLIDHALALGGTFYLPYQECATKEQFYKAYPNAQQWFALKKIYDPNELFMNNFYAYYGAA